MFKQSRRNNISIFIISQEDYDLLKESVRCNGNIYHIFRPNSFRDVRNLYQDKASMDMTPNEYKYLSSLCRNKKYQSQTIDMTKDKYQGR